MKRSDEEEIVLAGDIGGTKANLGVFQRGQDRPQPLVLESYSSAAASSLNELIADFLVKHSFPVSSACFGIAGPVIRGRVKTTNLPWEVTDREVQEFFNFASVILINDLTATGYSIPLLREEELFPVNTIPADTEGNVGLISPGTGLGMALLIRRDGNLIPLPSEGGHVDFAPTNEKQVGLWRSLKGSMDHVSVERVASGPGLFTIYKWLSGLNGREEPPWLTERFRLMDPPRAVSTAATVEKEPCCVESLEMFISIIGAAAGNLALTGMTTGGIFLGGGILPEIMPQLDDDAFMKAFTDKGRFRGILSGIPVNVILNDKAALLGAAQRALEARCVE
ncbi:MAG: glucokinase [Desulfomonile tiedjei]|uniref:Glucokinase n=1 Tax=Desulfomonile tiedjei TaxID=2358 RepID=A0A9D6UZA9_9BACT|nr:glucokinase [Desulfomonile tiedjei]